MSSSALPLAAPASRHRTVIAASRGIVPVRPGELWEFRELLFLLVWRDVKVRYKQTALGIAWAVIQPLLTMVVFTVIFGRLANLPSEGRAVPRVHAVRVAAVAAVRLRDDRVEQLASWPTSGC